MLVLWSVMVLTQMVRAFIRHGTLVDEKEGHYRYNVIVHVENGNTRAKLCSGTLLSPQLVYTSCQCVTELHVNSNGEKEPILLKLGTVRVFKGGERTDENEVIVNFHNNAREHCYDWDPKIEDWKLDASKDYALLILDARIDEKMGEKMCESDMGPVVPLFGPMKGDGHFRVLTFIDYLLPEDAKKKGGRVKPDVDCRSVVFGDSEEEEATNASPHYKLRVTTRVESIQQVAPDYNKVHHKFLNVTFEKGENGEISGTCKGDFGAGLICSIKNKPYLFGTVSCSTVNEELNRVREERRKNHPDGPRIDPDIKYGGDNQGIYHRYSPTMSHFFTMMMLLRAKGLWDEVEAYQVKCNTYYDKNLSPSPTTTAAVTQTTTTRTTLTRTTSTRTTSTRLTPDVVPPRNGPVNSGNDQEEIADYDFDGADEQENYSMPRFKNFILTIGLLVAWLLHWITPLKVA